MLPSQGKRTSSSSFVESGRLSSSEPTGLHFADVAAPEARKPPGFPDGLDESPELPGRNS